MGNTTASVHIAWRGNADIAAKAISRCYGKLGYERVKKALPEDGKHVVLLARPGQSYVSIYDSENAQFDNGELKDLALAASKALRAPAVFTSLYDSDSYEFIVFFNGRQIDLLMSDAENYEGPMKRLSTKARSAKWNSIFSRTLSAEQINAAAAPESVFADSIIAGLSELIGLRHGQPQMNYQDFLDEPKEITAQFHFKKKPKAISDLQASEFPAGEITLSDYFDTEQSFLRSVFPASFPIPVGQGCGARWLVLSQAAGFSGGTASIRVTGPDTLTLSKAIIAGCKFHNGQIVGKLETYPKILTAEDAAAFAETQIFQLIPVESPSSGSREYRGEFSNLIIPSVTPERTTQILLLVGLDLQAHAPGEWEINFSIRPGTQTEVRHHLPPVRIAALDQTWLPVVSGLNPKTTYDQSNLSANHLRELEYKQSKIPLRRRLDHPAITSTVAILHDEGQPTLDACKTWLEAWLRPLADHREGGIHIRAEKQMSESAYVGKTKKNLPVSDFLSHKIWGKLFDQAGNYQTVLVNFVPRDGDHPVAGIGLQHSFEERGTRERGGQQLSGTLSTMRGRLFETLPLGGTWHVFKWIINHRDCYNYLATSGTAMDQQLDSFAAERAPLQAWSSQCTWKPEFDSADSFERTLYEESSMLNWFRGILNNDNGLNGAKMTAQWCSNVLRMVTPHMWLCHNLIQQLDRAALEQAAEVSETNGGFRIALLPGCALDTLELALLPILPIENTRISVLL
ncbi:MAG TPA: hypothetical protein VK574_16060 [Terracidiphilus sp.]|nr:hypothetical protein [Terracidiphilus sp.]